MWRRLGERLCPAFAFQRHTAITFGVIVWGAIAYNTWSPLVLILVTMTVQWYAHDILQPHALVLMQQLPQAIFQQDNSQPHTARMSQDCLHTVTPFRGLPDPQICLQSSISGSIWGDELGIARV
ncbi:uncharacterized protein TNCV_1673451 [Trichonephila clavipes]|nr:uncharacterized protein TNCV_1673451 [Trichonephila clavipes]